ERIARGFFPAENALSVSAVHGGANNRVWRVDVSDGPFLLKQYYHAPAPARDRFSSERAFYDFAHNRVAKIIPLALNWKTASQAALFSFIAGRKLLPTEVTHNRVAQALDFYRRLNCPLPNPPPSLPDAAEACFSVADHLALVEKRVQRLLTIPITAADSLEDETRNFVMNELAPAWRVIEKTVRAQIRPLDDAPVARCISPSDFGFHNALLEESGRLRFFDFEYAGWDDPAKTIGDFLCQPDIPIGNEFREQVLETVAGIFPNDKSLPERARALLPVYQIKWCCIMLNEFLPANQERRTFSLATEANATRRQRQFTRACRALGAIAKN
ncbi:MAG TPA: aminoglycoside phosphotransferase family protein, partial [Opitutales bacterium]|nr:aminoglycoside phosphotransferase family protein [Opitutales bacterium]